MPELASTTRKKKLSDEKVVRFCSLYNSCNREPLFVPGGFAMRILVPWKPVVLVWGLLSAMIFLGFVASSLREGKDPFAPSATKAAGAQTAKQANHSHRPARTPNQ